MGCSEGLDAFRFFFEDSVSGRDGDCPQLLEKTVLARTHIFDDPGSWVDDHPTSQHGRVEAPAYFVHRSRSVHSLRDGLSKGVGSHKMPGRIHRIAATNKYERRALGKETNIS